MPILKIKKDGKWITIGSIDAKTLDNKPASYFAAAYDVEQLEDNKANKEHFHKTSDITEGILNIEQGGTNYSSMYDTQSESSATLRYRPSGLVPQETYPDQDQNGAIYWIYE